MTLDFDKMTWTCMACKRERPDAVIDVKHRPLRGLEHMFPDARVNFRYCNDDSACISAAHKPGPWPEEEEPMLDIWTMVVLSSQGEYYSTTVATSEMDLLDRLRENYDPEGELANTSDLHLKEKFESHYLLDIRIENHPLEKS